MASSTHASPSTSKGSTLLSISIPIRAPVTADDDYSDYDSQTETAYSETSSSFENRSEFEEYASGEEFDTASEMFYVDEENCEEIRPSDKYKLSRPPLVDPGEETSANSVVDEGESDVNGEYGPVVELGGPNSQPGMPVALLSVDEDEFDELKSDEGMVSGEEEDSRFAASGVTAQMHSLPRVRVSDVEDKDDLLLQKVGNGDIATGNSLEVNDSVINDSISVVGLGTYGEALLEKNEDTLKDKAQLNAGLKSVFDDSVINGSVSVVGLGAYGEALVEKKEDILNDKAELNAGLKSVFDDFVTVNVVTPKFNIEYLVKKKEDVLKQSSHLDDDDSKSVVEERFLYGDLGLESIKLNGGDEVDTEIDSTECDFGGKEQIGEAVNVFVDTHESDLSQVHSILAELQELEVEDDSSKNVVEAVINHVDGLDPRTVSEPEVAEEATNFIDGSVDLEKPEDETAQQTDMIFESVAPADPISVDSMENVDLLEVSEPDGLQNNSSFGMGEDVDLCSEKTAVQGSFISDADIESMMFGGPEATVAFMDGLEKGSSPSPIAVADDVEIVADSDEEMVINKEDKGDNLFDPAAIAALLKAAAGAELDRGRITVTSEDGRVFLVERPGSSFNIGGKTSQSDRVKDVGSNTISEEDKKLIEKIQHIRVKFLRLVQRLGLLPEDSVVAQVLYRLVLAAGGHVSDKFSLESAKRTALQLEAAGEVALDFSLNILVIGKTGVGKSATINSIFGEKKVVVNPFEPATSSVKEIVGTVNGVRIRVLDTPGLRSSAKEDATNGKILASIKKFTNKFPPDVVLYVDRLDAFARDFNDLPLLAAITKSLTTSIWRNAIVALTHAATVPPDGPHGEPLSFETFVARRSHVVQQAISQAVGDIRLMDLSMMHPVALVENHPSCRKNEDGESILSNGQSWRPQLLLLCYSLKILSEVNSVNKPRSPFNHRKLFGSQLRSLPVPHLLSSLLQSRPHLKLTAEQGGDDVDSDVESFDFSDSDEEDGDEYDQLPPFKPLKKSEVNKLSKEHRKAYFEEYDYRANLLLKKQLKEEVKRLKALKKKPKDSREDVNQEEEESPATVPVAMPDFSLPLSFDSDNPSYRYRALEPTSKLLVRPVLDLRGWDHDLGYDGINLERSLAISGAFPGAFSVQITKDKKEFNIHLDSSICAKHGKNGSTMAGFDIQNIGRQLAYILRTETQFRNFKLNKTSAGFSLSLSGENVATGLKIEDQIAFGKQLALAGSAGAVRSKGETALGANFEIRLKSKDYPVKQDQSTLGLSLIKWRGDLGVMANLQSQFSISRNLKMAIRVGMNKQRSGQISIKTSNSELQIAAICIFPILASIVRTLSSGSAARE